MTIKSFTCRFLLAALLLASTAGSAKTFYVETYGDDENNCSKSAPCADIQYVLDTFAGNNDRIVVGPGTYSGSLVIDHVGIKLTSVAGAPATVIEADGTDGILVNGDKSVIGQRRQGFTITGDFGGADGIHVNADKVRIEGNILIGPDTDILAETDDAIQSDGLNTTIRYNRLMNFAVGIYSNRPDDATKLIISDNYLNDILLNCIDLRSGALNKNQVKNNTLSNCEYGIDIANKLGAKSGDIYSGNIILNTAFIAVSVDSGNPVVTNNMIRIAEDGLFAGRSDGAVFRNNMVSDISRWGFRYDPDTFNTTFSANTIVNAGAGIFIPDGSPPLKQFSKNNILDYDCPIDFGGTVTGTIKMSKNFWGELGDSMPDLTCDAEANAALATDPGLVMKPSSKPNPVTYKSPF